MTSILYPEHLFKVLCIATVMVLSYHLNHLLVVESNLLMFPSASLIFIPSFVKLTSVLIFNWIGLLGVLVATLYIEISADRSFDAAIFTVLVFGCAPMIAFLATKKMFSLTDTLANLKYYHIMVLSAIAALFSIVNGMLGQGSIEIGYAMALGDFVTDMLLLFSLSVVLRGWEFFTRTSRIA